MLYHGGYKPTHTIEMPSGSQKWQRKIPPIVDDSIDDSPIEPLKPPLSSGFSIATFHDRRVSIWAHIWPTRAVAPDSSSRAWQ